MGERAWTLSAGLGRTVSNVEIEGTTLDKPQVASRQRSDAPVLQGA